MVYKTVCVFIYGRCQVCVVVGCSDANCPTSWVSLFVEGFLATGCAFPRETHSFRGGKRALKGRQSTSTSELPVNSALGTLGTRGYSGISASRTPWDSRVLGSKTISPTTRMCPALVRRGRHSCYYQLPGTAVFSTLYLTFTFVRCLHVKPLISPHQHTECPSCVFTLERYLVYHMCCDTQTFL